MKLPVKPKDKCNYTDNPVIEIIDKDGVFVAKVRNVETRDCIIKAINSHKIFKTALEKISKVEVNKVEDCDPYGALGICKDTASDALKTEKL